MRVGLIGCGWVAEQGHLPALARLDGVEIVALADLDPERLNRLGDSFGVGARYADPAGLLGDPAVEAVGVCVPGEAHVEVAIAAVDAGKHLLLEKPPALSLSDWDRLAARLEGAALTFMLGLNMRWHPAFVAARELIRAGKLGEIQCLRTAIGNESLIRADGRDWRRHRQRGGGALVEMGVHHLDLWRYLLDVEVEEVFATTRGDDENVAVAGRMESGVPVSSVFSHRTIDHNEVEIFGDAANLKVSPFRAPRLLSVGSKPWTIRARLTEVAATISPTQALRSRRAGGFFVASFAREWRHFVDAVERGIAPEPGLDSGRRLLQTLLAAAASTHLGRPVARVEAPQDLAPIASS